MAALPDLAERVARAFGVPVEFVRTPGELERAQVELPVAIPPEILVRAQIAQAEVQQRAWESDIDNQFAAPWRWRPTFLDHTPPNGWRTL